MPDVIEQLRSYGDAVEQAVEPVTRAVPRNRRPLLLVAGALVVLAAIGGAVWVLRAGGEDAEPPVVSTVDEVEPLTGWTTLDPGPLTEREGAAVVWTGEELVVWGGRYTREGGTGLETIGRDGYRDGAAYDPDADAWRSMALAPSQGGPAYGVWTGDEVLLWPEPDDPSGPRPGVAWNPDTDQWRRLATQPRPSDGVSAGTVVWTGREMVVVAYGAAYDPTSNSWRDLADPPFEGSVNDVVWTGEEIVASVGLGGGVEAYDPDADTWRTLAPLESTAGSVSLTSTGERIVAIDNDMAAWTLEDGHWQTVEQLPLRSSECGIDTVMTTTGVLAVHCAGYGLLDSDGRWSIGPPPTHPVMSLVATGDEVLAWWSTDEDFNFGPLARTWFQAYRPPERLGDDRALERTIPVGAVLLDLPADARLVRARGSLRYEVDLELGGVECRVTSTYLGDYPVAAGIRRTARDLDGAVLRHIRLPEVDVGRDRALVALVPQDQLDDRAHAYVEATTSDTVEITCPYLGRVERLLAGIHR